MTRNRARGRRKIAGRQTGHQKRGIHALSRKTSEYMHVNRLFIVLFWPAKNGQHGAPGVFSTIHAKLFWTFLCVSATQSLGFRGQTGIVEILTFLLTWHGHGFCHEHIVCLSHCEKLTIMEKGNRDQGHGRNQSAI